jgi:hypothetical protein
MQVQGFGTSLSNVSNGILLFSRYIFRLVVRKASTAATRMIINITEARSNTLLSGLETLALGINRKPQNPDAILRSFGALIDSIPSASLVRFTLLLIYPERSWLEQLDWLPFADALQRLHQELSPGTRKVVRVAIVAYQPELEQGLELVPLVQSALQCMKEYADVEVVGGLHRDFRAPYGVLTLPHFPMAVYVT